MASGKHFKYVILGGGVAAVRARAPPLRYASSLSPDQFPSLPPRSGFLFRRFYMRSRDGFLRTRKFTEILPGVPPVPLVCLQRAIFQSVSCSI